MKDNFAREKLVEIIERWDKTEPLVDYLLRCGVVVPPCRIGDTVYWVENKTEIKSGKVRQLGYENHIWLIVDVSKTKCVVLNEERGIFLTKEEAVKAREDKNNGKQQKTGR